MGKGQEVWELRSVEEMTIENWIQRVIIFSEMYLTKFNIYTNELNDIIKIPSIELVYRLFDSSGGIGTVSCKTSEVQAQSSVQYFVSVTFRLCALTIHSIFTILECWRLNSNKYIF